MESNYSGDDLRNQSFVGRNLTDYKFIKANLQGADFTGAIIQGADFSHSNCEDTKFCSAKAGLSFSKAFSLITILFFLVFIILVVLGYLGQRIGDGIGYSFAKFTADQQDRDELIASIWAIITCAALFTVFAYSIQRGLERAFRTMIAFGIGIIGLAMLRIVILSIVRFSVGYGVSSISGYAIRFLAKIAIAAVAGVGISFVAVAVATLIVVARILTSNNRKTVIVISSLLFLASISVTLLIHISRSASITTATFLIVTLFGIILGTYVAEQASNNQQGYNLVNEMGIGLSSRGGTNFQEATLTNADFANAYLIGTDFRNSDLKGTCWRGVRFLTQSRLDGTCLYLKDLEKRLLIINLITTGNGDNGNFEGLKLQEINLQGAMLRQANFRRADLSSANLRGANLQEAILVQTRLDRTDLTDANLTGAFIEKWGATGMTKLDRIKCDFVYMKESVQGSRDIERIPRRGEFKENEFEQFAKSLIGTLDLFHQDDFDSRAVVISFKQLADQYPEETFRIVALERSEHGHVTVKVKTKYPENNDIYKGEYFSGYDRVLPLLPSQTDQLPEAYMDLDKVIGYLEPTEDELLSDNGNGTIFRNVTIMGNLNANGKIFMGDIYNVNQAAAVGKDASAHGTTFIQSDRKQNLAEAAAEIQKLLRQLEQTNPVATESEKIAHVNGETTPNFKQRVVSALTAGGETAIEEFLDNSYFNVVKAIVKGWRKPE